MLNLKPPFCLTHLGYFVYMYYYDYRFPYLPYVLGQKGLGSVEPDWMPQNVMSDQDLHCLSPIQQYLTIKAPSKICSRRHLFLFFFNFSMITSLDISCESSAKQTIHMKYQDLFSLKNKKKKYIYIFQNVVCCNCD